MSLAAAIFLIVAAFVTAAISGVFGMAGGLMLKGAIALVLPVSATFVTHGLLQLVANGWRAVLHRKFLDWRIVAVFAVGSIVAGAPARVSRQYSIAVRAALLSIKFNCRVA